MSERKIVQCRSSFVTTINGRSVMVIGGDLYYDDDPIVKGRAGLFVDPRVKSSQPAAQVSAASVETASAPPAARRVLSKPPAKSDVKSPAKSEPKPEGGKADA